VYNMVLVVCREDKEMGAAITQPSSPKNDQ
jgi:hypothetical protein